MSAFEDRLWNELATRHRHLLAEGTAQAPRRTRAAALIAAAAAAIAATLAVATLWLSGGTGAPAYAVTQHPDGTVTVTIRQLAGVQGADARLAMLGVPVRTAAVEAGCTLRPGQFRPVPVPPALFNLLRRVHGGPGQVAITVMPDAIPAGDTLLLGARQVRKGVVVTNVTLYRGAAPSCLPPATVGG